MEEDISWVDIEVKSSDHDCNIIFDNENKIGICMEKCAYYLIRLGFIGQIVQNGVFENDFLDLGIQKSDFGPTLFNSCCLKKTLNILQMKIVVALWLMMMVQLCARYVIKG